MSDTKYTQRAISASALSQLDEWARIGAVASKGGEPRAAHEDVDRLGNRVKDYIESLETQLAAANAKGKEARITEAKLREANRRNHDAAERARAECDTARRFSARWKAAATHQYRLAETWVPGELFDETLERCTTALADAERKGEAAAELLEVCRDFTERLYATGQFEKTDVIRLRMRELVDRLAPVIEPAALAPSAESREPF